MQIMWTPPNGQPGIGTIVLPGPMTLTPMGYEARLETRINKMVAQEEPERALELLQRVAEMEKLLVTKESQLTSVGNLLVENSQWLRERAQMPIEDVEIKGGQTVAEETPGDLETFLDLLYQDHE